jgi:hypothetical protein
MKKINLLFIAFIATTLIVVSCGKYEEGPSISLRSKTARITGTWKDVAVNDSTYTDGDIVIVEKDGKIIIDGEDGTWAFTDDKEGVIISFSFEFMGETITVKDTSIIVRLTNSEMWTKGNGANDTDIYKSEKQ